MITRVLVALSTSLTLHAAGFFFTGMTPMTSNMLTHHDATVSISWALRAHSSQKFKKNPLRQQPKDQTTRQVSVSESRGSKQLDTELAHYLDEIRTKITNEIDYPDELQDWRHTGQVAIQMSLGIRGEILDLALGKSSGSPTLDRHALHALGRLSPFTPPPTEGLVVTVPLEFKL